MSDDVIYDDGCEKLAYDPDMKMFWMSIQDGYQMVNFTIEEMRLIHSGLSEFFEDFKDDSCDE